MKRFATLFAVLLVLALPALTWGAQMTAQRGEIIRAEYGFGNRWTDVTERVASLTRGNVLRFRVDDATLGVTSRPGSESTLRIEVRDLDGQTRRLIFRENEEVNLRGYTFGTATTTGGLRILSAIYAYGGRSLDVTRQLNSQIRDGRLSLQVTNETMGGDPAPNRRKTLTVRYLANGQEQQSVLTEGEYLNLSSDTGYGGNTGYGGTTGTGGYSQYNLQITRARYGSITRSNDVTERLNSQIRDGQLNLQVTNETMGGDPDRNRAKTLTVNYTLDGRADQLTVAEGDFLRLPATSGYLPPVGQTIRCESANYRRVNCPADTRGSVRLVRKLGDTDCVRGSSWDYDQNGIWVDNGCRGEFELLSQSGSTPGYGAGVAQTIRCESENFRRQYCAANTSGGVRLLRKLGDTECVRGTSWDVDRDGIWVDNGCRGEFELLSQSGSTPGYGAGAGSAQNIRCESSNNTRQLCSVDTRGGVRLLRKLSDAECVRGSSWDYDQFGIWVDNGCRADFEVTSQYGSTPSYGAAVAQTIRCESTNFRRNNCPADTSGGVRLLRKLGDSDCVLGTSWDYDLNGIWVDNGCRGEFEVLSQTGTTSGYPWSQRIIPSGTQLSIRTNEAIDSNSAREGQRYSAMLEEDVRDNMGALAIPKGADAQLVIHSTTGSDLALDVESVTFAGQRYYVQTAEMRRAGGGGKRTAGMAVGGAAIGAVIGAIVGGGKGAAIGAVIGGAGGAGVAVLTKGKEVRVPPETVLNFKLEQDLSLAPQPY
jgi:hypothetical protein